MRVHSHPQGEMQIEADAILWEATDAVFLDGGVEVARLPAASLHWVRVEDETGALIRSIRSRHPQAYTSWTDDDDRLLLQMAKEEVPLEEMVQRLGRQPSAVRSRLRKLAANLR